MILLDEKTYQGRNPGHTKLQYWEYILSCYWGAPSPAALTAAAQYAIDNKCGAMHAISVATNTLQHCFCARCKKK